MLGQATVELFLGVILIQEFVFTFFSIRKLPYAYAVKLTAMESATVNRARTPAGIMAE